MPGEVLAMITKDVNFWNKSVLSLINKIYVNRNFFNVNKFRLFYKLKPDEILAIKGKICPEGSNYGDCP